MSDKDEAPKAEGRKKGGLKKMLMLGGALVVLVGGGVGAGLYAASSGMIGGGTHAKAEDPDTPKLVPKSAQKRAGEEEGGGGHGGGGGGESEGEGAAAEGHGGTPTPEGEGGERFASNYYAMDKEFTANLQDSIHYIQVGVAVSTPYDDKVIANLKTNDIAVRSAVLMALGDTTEDQVFTSEGKKALQKRLVAAINQVLREKEGFGGVGNVYFTNFVVQ